MTINSNQKKKIKIKTHTLLILSGLLMLFSFYQANAAIVDIKMLDELLDEGLITQQQFDLKNQQLQQEAFNSSAVKNVKSINAGMGSISGQVTDENGDPIEFQKIRLVNALSLGAPIANVETDASGNYTFTNLTAGDYVLYSRGGGYLRYIWANATSGGPQLCSGCYLGSVASDHYITVGVDEAVTGIDISTRLGGKVSGYIKDADSSVGVTTLIAILYNVDGSDYQSYTAIFDSVTGAYTIDAIPNGTYKIYLEASTQSATNFHIPQLYPNIQCNDCSDLAIQGQGDDLIIDTYNSISNINFNLNYGGSISGKIVDAVTGNPMAEFGYFLVFDELNNLLFTRYVLGSNYDPSATGDYIFGGLLPGNYYVQGGDLGRDFYRREVYNNTPCYWSGCTRSLGSPVIVRAKQDTPNIDFLLEKGGKISGTITSAATGLPITDANVQVQFIDANNVVVGGAYVKQDGTYLSARALPPGDYAVRTGNLFVGVLTQPYVNEKYNDVICSGLACDLTTADVNVTADNVTPNIDFVLDTGLSFSGTLTEVGTGNPIPDVHVLVYKDMGDGTVKFANWATTSDGSTAPIGSFTVNGLPAGTYYAVTNNGHRLPFLGYRTTAGNGWLDILYDSMICPANGCDIISGTPIVLAANKTVSAPLNIQLAKGASISGKIIDDVLAAPIGQVQVNVYNQAGIYYGSYTTDELGYYKTAGLPADTYYLTTTSFEVLIDAVYGDKPCYSGSCNYQDAQPIVLAAQQDAINKDFVLIPKSDFFFISGFE